MKVKRREIPRVPGADVHSMHTLQATVSNLTGCMLEIHNKLNEVFETDSGYDPAEIVHRVLPIIESKRKKSKKVLTETP